MGAQETVGEEMKYKGIYKLIEECGELLQVLGKLGPFPDGEHPDGGQHLQIRLENELADLQAAILYFEKANPMNLERMSIRIREKVKKFRTWESGLTGLSGEHI